MGHGSDSLHFDGIPLVQSVVQDSWGIQHLPPNEVIICMADKDALGCERVRLHVQVGVGDLVDEG